MTGAGAGAWLDLTRPVGADLPIYGEGDYRDPPFRAERWCGVADAGFEVWRLEMGTQTGTHLDAPGHFVEGGATLDGLDPSALIGRYFHVTAGELARPGAPRLGGHRDEPILFLDALEAAPVPEAAVARALALPCPVWVVAGELRVADRPPLHFHRLLAGAGRFLVEDLEPGAAARVARAGEIVALPLRLAGLTGAPARVLARAWP